MLLLERILFVIDSKCILINKLYIFCNGCAGPARDLRDPGSIASNSG